MKAQNELSDSELLQLMAAGDEEAFASLYRGQQATIYRFALQMCGSRELAEDITQETFMVLIRDSRRFDPARGSLNSFLLGVARNHLLRRLRRERNYVAIEPSSDNDSVQNHPLTTDGPLDAVSHKHTIESLRKAVLSLPERYRDVVVLCDLQEMSYVETAEILGCAVGTVRSRLHRARGLLIDKLRPAREEDETSAAVKSARCFA